MAPDRTDDLAVLAAATSANFGQFGARVVISPFVLAIAATYGASKADVGIVLTLLWATFACTQFPSGVFADRFGERRIIALALALTAVGSLLVAVAPTYATFAVAAIVLGLGAGLYFPVGTALLSRHFDRTARPFSVHSAGAPIAGLVLPVAATAIAGWYDWRAGVAIGAVVAALALAFVLGVVEPRPPTTPEVRVRERFRPRTIAAVLTRPGVAFTTALGALGMYAFQSFVSFFPTFLQEYHGLTAGGASRYFGATFLIIAVFLPVVGWLADRFDADAGLVVPYLTTATGVLLLLVGVGGPALLVGVAVVGVGLTWGGALQSRMMAQFAPGEKGTGFGLARTTFVLLGSTGNVATGWLAEVAGWPAALGAVVAVLLAATALVLANRTLGWGL